MRFRRQLRAQHAPTAVVMLAGLLTAVAMVAGRAVPAHAQACFDVAWTASACAALVGILAARQSAENSERRRWTLWALATGCWLAGQLGWDAFGILGYPSSPNPADLGWWAFAAVVMVSLTRSHARSRSVRIVVLSETLPVIGAAVALSIAELWPDAAKSSLAAAPKISALIYPALYIAALVVMVQARIGGSLRGVPRPVVRLVCTGLSLQAIGFSLWSTQLLANTYQSGRSWLDPLWAIGLMMIGAAGLLAARHREAIAEIDEPADRGALLPAAMFLALAVALIDAQLRDAATGIVFTLCGGLVLSATALVARSRLLERRLRDMLERERNAMAALSEREAELARLNEQLVEDSRRDPLTGMRNRRALADDLLELEAGRMEGDGGYALALCDVDHFKAYNDRLGHLAGDQALRTIAAVVRATLRSGDLCYRFGGEEVLLVLRDAGPEEAHAVAERVRAAVQAAGVPHPDGVGGLLTVSVGVAAGHEDSDLLLTRADGALYDAKHGGRNQTVSAADVVSETPARRQRERMEEPVPRHLRSMLTVSRAAAAGNGPMPVLEALAETIRSELSFHVVAVNLFNPAQQTMDCVIVLGDDDARAKLLGDASPWAEWEQVIQPQYERCGALWLPAGSPAWEDQTLVWTPAMTAVPGPNGWHPNDMLLLPLRGQAGDILGAVSVDQPASGKRPEDSDLALLMSVVDHAALGLEQSLRDTAHTEAAAEPSSELQLAAVMLLAETLDLRDPGTARHSRTVGALARRTAEVLGLDEDHTDRIHAAGVVHDLGKLGIGDAVLYKPGPLNDGEWEEMKRHPEIGARILMHAGLRDIARWVRAHHERVDGGGYPDGLGVHEIPLEARILAVADAYEAMIADRPYRPGMPSAAAREELERCSGTQFDPAVVTAFLAALDERDVPVAADVPGALPVPA